MLKRIPYSLFFIFILLFRSSMAQSSIDIYGYVQSSYSFFHNVWNPYAPPGEDNYTYNNMGINQLNLFVAKDLGNDLSSFINFEFINDYSSDKGFGSFNLSEAYLKWDYRDFLKVKFGMIIPQFNSLFEIYNRTPLLPYLIRPKLYDATSGNLVDIFDILPQKALIQVYGSVPVGAANIEYALFAGNPPNKFLSSPNNDLLPSYVAFGRAAVSYVSVGGRVGIKTSNLRIGVSACFDKDSQRKFIKNSNPDTVNLGDFNRYHIGSDFYLKVGNFELSAEYLKVKTKVSSDVQDSLNVWNAADPYDVGKSFDKTFYYATLLYNISSKLFVYTMYDYLNDDFNPFYFGLDGFYGYHLGGGYYVNDNILLKIQYFKNFARFDTGEAVIPIRDYYENNLAIGVSITF